jgi:hypothetical protein
MNEDKALPSGVVTIGGEEYPIKFTMKTDVMYKRLTGASVIMGFGADANPFKDIENILGLIWCCLQCNEKYRGSIGKDGKFDAEGEQKFLAFCEEIKNTEVMPAFGACLKLLGIEPNAETDSSKKPKES